MLSFTQMVLSVLPTLKASSGPAERQEQIISSNSKDDGGSEVHFSRFLLTATEWNEYGYEYPIIPDYYSAGKRKPLSSRHTWDNDTLLVLPTIFGCSNTERPNSPRTRYLQWLDYAKYRKLHDSICSCRAEFKIDCLLSRDYFPVYQLHTNASVQL